MCSVRLYGLTLLITLVICGSIAGQDDSEYVFGDSTVYEYRLYFWQTDFWDSLVNNYEVLDEEYMPCNLVFEDSTYDSIGVRFKGFSSYNLYPGPKKSFKLDFDRYREGQTFYGLKKINLNNGFLDPSFMREKVFLDVIGEFVPCSRSAYARLYINDKYWGLYTVIEQIDKTFLQSHFGESEDGNLFKGEPMGDLLWYGPDQEEYYDNYELKTNEEENDWSDLLHLIDVLNHTSSDSLAAVLPQVIDVRNYLTFQALNNLFVNLDSYYGLGHNFYVYHIQHSDRFIHIPWDVNESFGSFNRWIVPPEEIINHTIFYILPPGGQRPLSERTIFNPVFIKQYSNYVAYLVDHQFTPEYIFPKLDYYQSLIRPAVYDDTLKMFSNQEFEDNIDSTVTSMLGPVFGLKWFVNERRDSVIDQLSGWPAAHRFFINEFMAANDTTVADETGEYEDWIEIYNDNLFPVSLAGYYLTDDFSVPDKWPLPDTVLEAGGFLLIWADNEPADGAWHAGFKLSAAGERLALVGPTLAFADSLTFGEQTTDRSFGRYLDGLDNWTEFVVATPGEANYIPSNLPPVMVQTTQTPPAPSALDSVIINSYITDEDGEVVSVELLVDTGDGFWARPMLDDGDHHDGLVGDGLYGAIIGPQPESKAVAYYVSAVDDSGGVAFDPAGAPAGVYGYIVGYRPPRIVVNEFLAANDFCCTDEYGGFDDWIELYNTEAQEVSLAGMYLTDELGDPRKFLIGDTTIPAGGFIVFWADDDTLQGLTHTNFKLGASGEEIGLYNTDAYSNQPITTLTFTAQTTDVSYGRLPDGRNCWTQFETPTPQATNGDKPCGDANDDLAVNVGDAVYLINYIFKGGNPPGCHDLADANGDCAVNVGDAVYLINFIFKNGLFPTCSCVGQ